MKHTYTHLPIRIFIKRLIRNIGFGIIIISFSLLLGMWGYHYFENMNWIDAYVNATMILSGMGPVSPLHTDAGKIFAGTYALFSGTVFLIVIAIIFGPLIQRIIHKFHFEEGPKQKK